MTDIPHEDGERFHAPNPEVMNAALAGDAVMLFRTAMLNDSIRNRIEDDLWCIPEEPVELFQGDVVSLQQWRDNK